ncbi:MAG: DedA family protein [Candidatus Thermoplasmatota archaeon]|jgi:membrane protein DedA with SNARE-associated domain|nr:DedA family protein [Candidatus Thermoplasmatota archaeon]
MLSFFALINEILHDSTIFVSQYGYYGITVLMFLESASIPIPSEVIMPLAGHYSRIGILNPILTIFIAVVAGVLGALLDYYIALAIGKEAVYKHAGFFHISRDKLDTFDDWFSRNGVFAVFIVRLLPAVRGLISFPAGFAGMPLKKFVLSTALGSMVWDTVLFYFGYYALSLNIYLMIMFVAILGVVLTVIYYVFMHHIQKNTLSGS